ncbi:MAG TPA: hypothetical protein VMA35_04065 [Candidatus Sulfopaludibacter sp.]|nr:hypothetical protein [Candidatus Sulfopaludibacter sp.]
MKIKTPTRWLAAALAVMGGLSLAGWARAQDIYYFDNFYPPWPPHSALYSNWNNYPSNPSAVNFNTIFAFTNSTLDDPASGLEVISTIGGYGSGYADLNSGVGVTFANGNTALATNDTLCVLTFTVNPTPSMAASGSMFYTNYNWVGIQFYLNCDSGVYDAIPVGYAGWNNPGNSNGIVWSGSNVTVTIDMSKQVDTSGNHFGAVFVPWTQGGTNHFYGCNLGINPAVMFNDPAGSSGLPYDRSTPSHLLHRQRRHRTCPSAMLAPMSSSPGQPVPIPCNKAPTWRNSVGRPGAFRTSRIMEPTALPFRRPRIPCFSA